MKSTVIDINIFMDFLFKRRGHECVVEINEELLNKALNSQIDDFEDAVIEVSAIDRNVDYIITRNIKDFKKSSIPAKTPEEFILIVNDALK